MPHTGQKKVILVALIAGAVPWLISNAAALAFGPLPFAGRPLHTSMVVAGSCIALGIAMLLFLRTRHEAAAGHLLWVAASLQIMGLMDLTQGFTSLGISSSWFRHVGTLMGGILFALVWLPVPDLLLRQKGRFMAASSAVALVICLGLLLNRAALPPAATQGGYTLTAKLVHGLGGLCFFAAAAWFFRRALRDDRIENFVFGAQAVLFGTAGVFYGFSQPWETEWWAWHTLRLIAYASVLVVAYTLLAELFEQTAGHARELTARVEERTAELQAIALFLDENPAPVLRAAADGTLLYANRASAPLLEAWSCKPNQVLPEEVRHSISEALSRGDQQELEISVGERTLAFLLRRVPERNYLNLYGRDISERKRTEAALEQSEAEFRTLFELSGVGNAQADPATGRFLRVNERFCEITGHSQSELLSLTFLQLTHPADRDRESAIVEPVLRGELDRWDIEKRYLRPDGKVIWVHVSGRLIRNAAGLPYRTIAGIVDITPLKRAQEALQRTEQQLRLVTDAAPGLISYIDQNQRYQFVNKQYEKWFGRSSAEVVGRTMTEVLGDGAMQRLGPFVSQVLLGEHVRFEIEAPYREGGTRWIDAQYVPDRDGDATVIGFFVLVLDVTERKQAELERDRFFDFSTDLLAIASSHDGLWKRVNPAFSKTLGWQEQELLQKPYLGLVHPEDLEHSREASAHLASGKSHKNLEHRVLCKNGGYRWISWSTSLYPAEQLIYCFGRDVTEQKRTEEALRKSEQSFRELAGDLEAERNKLKAVIENLPVGIGIGDANGTTLLLNRAGLELHGFASEEEMLARLEHYADEFELRSLEGRLLTIEEWPVMRAIQGEFLRNFEVVLNNTRRRSQHIVSYSVAPVSNNQGEPALLVYVIQDLTERKRAEEALKRSEQRLRWALQAANGGAWDYDLVTLEAWWSDEMYDLWGVEPGRVMTLPTVLTYVVPEDRESLRLSLDKALREYGDFRSEFRIKHPARGMRWMAAFGRHVKDRSHLPARMIGITTDVTARKEAEDRLRQSELFHRQTLESIPGMVFTTRSDGYCDYQSQQWVEYTGVPLIEHLGDGWSRLLHPADQPNALKAWDEAVAGRAPYELEYRVRRRDGVFEWFRVIGAPIRDHDGAIVRWFGVALNIEKLKRAEQALSENERFVRRVLNNLFAFVGVLSPDGTVADANRAPLEAAGISPDDVVGRKFWDCYWWNYSGEVQKQLQNACERARDGELVRYDVPVRMRGDTRMWIDFQIAPLYDDQGLLTHLIPSAMDISGRKKAEEVLQQQYERLSILSDALAGLLSTSDYDQITRELFPQVAKHLNAEVYFHYVVSNRGQELQLRAADGLPSDIPAAIHRLEVGQALCGRAAELKQQLIVTDLQNSGEQQSQFLRDLGLKAYACNPLLIEDRLLGTLSFGSRTRCQFDEGQLEFLRLVARYLSVAMERMQNEQALREGEERLRMAQSAAQLGIFDHDLVAGELRWDARVYELWGVAPSTTVNAEVFLSGLHPQDREATQRALKEATDPAGPGLYFAEYRVINKSDQQTRWIASSGKVTFENFKAVRMVGTFQDITKQKEFQAELERLVNERTAKLQEVVGELEHFSYTITHDMRAPLRALHGFGNILLEDGGDNMTEQQKHYLGRIVTAADRMDRLITDALQYNLMVRTEIKEEPVNTTALLQGMLETYPAFQQPHATIEIASSLPWVLANKAALTQVFSNLLGNAVKFVEPGRKPAVKVWAEQSTGPGDAHQTNGNSGISWVRLCFQDNGIGIKPEYKTKVWGMFQRLDKNYEGTGIGLALVQKAVSHMGGEVGLHSEYGKGSCFWVVLKQAAKSMPLQEDAAGPLTKA